MINELAEELQGACERYNCMVDFGIAGENLYNSGRIAGIQDCIRVLGYNSRLERYEDKVHIKSIHVFCEFDEFNINIKCFT